jgi:ketosteroid isomerase-like protein
MRPVSVGICLVVVIAVSAVGAHEDNAADKAEVQTIYDHIGKALQKKDIDGVTKFSLPEATVKYADGKELTLKEWKERAGKGWADIKQMKSQFQVQEAQREGDATVATYTETHNMLVFDPKDGQEHKIGYQAKWSVTLTKTADGWRLKRSVELERRVTRDGVLVDQLPKDRSKP